MRSLRLTLYFIIGLLLGAVSAFSFAADGTNAGAPKIQSVPPTAWIYPGLNPFATFSDFCNEIQRINQASYIYTVQAADPGVSNSTPVCIATVKSTGVRSPQGDKTANPQCPSGYGFSGGATQMCKSSASVCPVNSTNVSGTCTCNSGLVYYDGQCKAPVCTNTGNVGNKGFFTNYADACQSGCLATFQSATNAGGMMICPNAKTMLNGSWVPSCEGQYRYSGQGSADRCTPGTGSGQTQPFNQASPTNQPTCPAGQSLFYVNNNPGCVTSSTGQVNTEPPKKVTTNTTTTNPDGSTTITTKTVDQGTGETTTSSVTYPAGGTVPTVPSTSESESDYGKTNGSNPGASTGSGSGNGNGDHPTSCDQDPERVGCKHLSDITGEVPDPADINKDERNMDFAPASGFGAGSYSCPATEYITVQGRQIPTANWGPVCDFANLINPIVIAFAFLGAALIAFAGRSS